ncbi:hypothetical protein [Aquitalea sp. LB_tupeE]|uniref:hypothetical protein n=1 Tax=Aquitalea sp. LB_tupeE TaxID=2748078 RepID=UPI0015BEC2EE|nr:hypothetical protein [Aquitalea sp. LB_tupeE]NWK77228.1 hypothetical protein [Aquitalea sp. LB_tupeE]
MTKPLNLHEHFTPIPGDPDGAMHLSMPATLLVIADCINSDDSTPEGQQRAKAVITEFVAMLRKIHWPQAEYLETWLLRGNPDARRLLPALVKAVDAVGQMEVGNMLNRMMEGL